MEPNHEVLGPSGPKGKGIGCSPTPPEKLTLGYIKPGTRLLELGNKKRKREGLYRDWYKFHGIKYWCTDINGQDGAIPWDIRTPIIKELQNLAPFDVITNFGFTEHVQTDSGQDKCWANIHNLLKLNGQLSCSIPQPGFWKNHGISSGFPGIYYPNPEFYEELTRLNGYEIKNLWINEDRHLVCCRLIKINNEKFIMPKKGMFKNI